MNAMNKNEKKNNKMQKFFVIFIKIDCFFFLKKLVYFFQWMHNKNDK